MGKSDKTVTKSDGSIFSGTFTQLLATISGSLFAISDGMTYGWTAPMMPYLISEESHIKTTKSEVELLETILMVGSFCGLPTTIYLVDKIGRKKSLLLAAFSSLIGWLVIAFADKMIYIHVVRFFFGVIGNMSFVSMPMYIAEIAESKIRGFLASVVYLQMLIGFVIVYSVGPYLPFYVAPIIGIVVLITELCVFSWMPESPYYLLYKNKHEQAEKSMEYFRPGKDISLELKQITKAIERQKTEKGGIKDIIMVKSNRKAIIIMTVLNGGQHIVAISVILMNLHDILNSAGSIYMDSSHAGILFSVIMLVFANFASLQVDRYGRKALLLLSTTLTGFCLLAIAVYFNLMLANYDVVNVSWIPIASVMIYAATFKIGLGVVPIVITAEIFPAKVKALGMTIADAMYVIGSIISIQLYTWLESSYGKHVPFYVFTVGSFCIALFILKYLPETKGKTLEEIQFLLKGERYIPTSKSDPLINGQDV
ncbi:unnamed protein product [Phyllotreta striolata]|uniref:Major facilitator superfamily (MFS) profile domain-containing protein n=1 Tax=Phyllotreta striolata TaxID=444603 RepID=A0A9N9TAV7_PHYSR|nr:unnamed protein product [Phyllotreta striolata]